ncbi:MAG: permease-like cell division protein FtsX [Clostridiales bacterium]|nr:permease-like cell division protein FtsX [Clostridiales bacterium]
MKGASLSYLTKEGLRNVRVNRLMSIASVSVLMFCMIIVGLAFSTLTNVNVIADSIEDKNVMEVFVADEAEQEQIDKLGNDLNSLDNVKSVVLVTPEEALEQTRKKVEGSDALWEGIDESIFPYKYIITVDALEKFDDTLDQIKKLDNVQKVNADKIVAEKIHSIRIMVYYTSIVLIAAFLLMSIFIISNTIRITIFSRRLEISIMKSVGATRSFIRWPFMIEGMVIGLIAGVLGFLVVWGSYSMLCSFLVKLDLDELFQPVEFFSFAWNMLATFLAGGIIIGGLGSGISVGRYLKEQSYDVIEEQI